MTDVNTMVTAKLIAAIEAGMTSKGYVMPWHGRHTLPYNVASGKPYKGINIVVLWGQGSPSSLWGTYKQWADKKAQVRKGERGVPVLFFKPSVWDTTNAQGQKVQKRSFITRASIVFSAEQVDGFEAPPRPKGDASAIDSVDAFVKRTGANIGHGGNQACYYPGLDRIAMPHRDDFLASPSSTATENYYSVLMHELTHWTGHKSRLDRNLDNKFKSQGYAMEELVAELGAAYACAHLGISMEPRDDHAKYLAGWLKVLKADSKALVIAGSMASKAFAYLEGL